MNAKISVFGDVILDKFTYGEVRRINPEAPAPIFDISRSEYKLGGAANVANNLNSLGVQFKLYGAIGNDIGGTLVRTLSQNFQTQFIVDDCPTIIKQRYISETFKQQVFRADEEQIRGSNSNVIEQLLAQFTQLPSEYIILSDYNKGFLCKNLVTKLKFFNDSKILVDPKPENISLFHDVYLIKMNLKEAGQVYGREILNLDGSVEKAIMRLTKKYNSNFIITRGAMGSTFSTKEGLVKHIPQEEVKVFDVTGAGDTYIATLGFALSELNYNLEDAILIAQMASKIVVQKPGTATITRDELKL